MRLLRRFRACAALGLVALCAPGAFAAEPTDPATLSRTLPIDNTVTRTAQRVAIDLFRARPACGPMHFYSETRLYDATGPVDALANERTCTIWLRPTKRERVERCTLLVHEVGHLVGRNHITDPRSIMATADVRGGLGLPTPRGCARRFDRDFWDLYAPFATP